MTEMTSPHVCDCRWRLPLGAAYLAGHRSAGAASIPKLGMQLYTVRDLMAKDFDGTLGSIAAIGYKEVEFAGYFDKTPEQVRDVAEEARPDRAVGAHSLREPRPGQAAGRHRGREDDRSRLHRLPLARRRAAKRAGCLEEGHRHAEQRRRRVPEGRTSASPITIITSSTCPTADGKLPFDVILETCDPKQVKIELDLFWITVAGKDPLEYFKKYPGRFPLVHVKGMSTAAPALAATTPTGDALKAIADVGDNDKIDWKRIFAQSKQAGIQHYFVENDVPKQPLESLKTSYAYLSKLQF